jgi:outer membrane protein OmpA-like peptidoglycan-associated protein
MVLGESRADSVRDYLMSLGVPKENLTETSRGKLDATGTDEATWRIDRRVDVDLM